MTVLQIQSSDQFRKTAFKRNFLRHFKALCKNFFYFPHYSFCFWTQIYFPCVPVTVFPFFFFLSHYASPCKLLHYISVYNKHTFLPSSPVQPCSVVIPLKDASIIGGRCDALSPLGLLLFLLRALLTAVKFPLCLIQQSFAWRKAPSISHQKNIRRAN